MKNDIYILAIESSCDETSIAIVKNGCEVIAMSTNTQISVHENYGGVVPEIASRMHCESITLVLEDMLRKTDMKIEDIDAIAVTYAPGLLGSLLVGIEFAKTLSYVYNKPLIKVNHLIGHIYANNLEKKLEFPLLALIVSGGHTELVKMTGDYKFELLGETLDDAIGEAYDKVARVLGLKYPGGPNVEKLALSGESTYKMNKLLNDDSYNFSYSGLKSSVININHNETAKGNVINKANLARSFQDAAIEELYRKCELAIKNTGINRLLIAGGVSANSYLRSELSKLVTKYNGELLYPRMLYCTDNAAMIGAAAYPLYLNKDFCDYSLNGKSNIDIC
mgnify:FL=1